MQTEWYQLVPEWGRWWLSRKERHSG